MENQELGNSSSCLSSAESCFDILFDFQGSKQPLSVTREDVIPKIENQLAKLGIEYSIQ